MFANHQPLISESALASPEGLERVVQFVSLTIQQPIETVPAMLSDILDGIPDAERYLFGSKRLTWAWLAENREQLYSDVWRVLEGQDNAEDALVHLFAQIPGIGVVKSGFCVQLSCGLSGCLDTHNLARYGINPNTYRASRYQKASAALKSRIVSAYNEHCALLGGTARLWDTWCEYVSENRGGKLSAMQISELHLCSIV